MCRNLVTVIVPVYNSEKYLRHCLDSVANQTYRNLEILLIDDGSTDGSGQICDAYAERDTRFKVVHTVNRGIAATQNDGLDLAQGTYIAFCDDDDIMDHRNIELLVEALQGTDADMAKGRWRQFGISDISLITNEALKDKPQGQQTVLGNPLKEYQTVFSKTLRSIRGKRGEVRYFNEANWCRLYRREVWEGIRFPEGKYAQDVMVAGELYLNIHKVVDLDEVLYYWLQSPDSVTHSKRSFGYFHDNVQAGAKNFELSLNHGIIPQRSYYTMTTMLRQERKILDESNSSEVQAYEEDKAWIDALVARLGTVNRMICAVTATLRLLEKVVYDRRIHSMK